MNIIIERKKYIIRLLREIEKCPATLKYRQEMMVFSYVLVCGAIEFMTENILQNWLAKTIKHHTSSKYRGKKYVQNFIEIQTQAREKNIENFTSTKLSEIKKLVGNIVGEKTKEKFNSLLDASQQSTVIEPDIAARLERINRTRHDLAHGKKIPNDIQPNISELKEDFIFVYNHIIGNIIKCLPKV
ncbi:hypothetical protein HZC21_03740 [Candidatus Peregrinibacteria bacterium]|nr:hypothetical protein [Candidatus Peregrinibacteria bacterium]